MLNDMNPFDYLTERQRHTEELAAKPADWMPWNYRVAVERASQGHLDGDAAQPCRKDTQEWREPLRPHNRTCHKLLRGCTVATPQDTACASPGPHQKSRRRNRARQHTPAGDANASLRVGSGSAWKFGFAIASGRSRNCVTFRSTNHQSGWAHSNFRRLLT